MSQDSTFRAALVQLCSGREIEPNMAAVCGWIREAAGAGARYIQTPENTLLMESNSDRLFERVREEADTPEIAQFAALAEELGVWLHIGSIFIKASERKAANRSYIFAPTGRVVARYDKIHLFDVELPGGESHRETETMTPGSEAVAVALPWGLLGLSICYDLRFPEQYKALAKAGARMLAVPAAFTEQTGRAHWHVLLRARAIETGSFVLAAAQGGVHEAGRHTFGHSLILSPWGEVLAEAGAEPGVITADIDLAEAIAARHRIPALKHERPFNITTV
ncbi:MAG: carbon-nitrogen hydrolase family protein [Alphaproteobacteria bacterium]